MNGKFPKKEQNNSILFYPQKAEYLSGYTFWACTRKCTDPMHVVVNTLRRFLDWYTRHVFRLYKNYQVRWNLNGLVYKSKKQN